MTPKELRARLAGADPAYHQVSTLIDETERPDGASLAPAAVLVGLITGPAPGILLTKRAGHLRSHSGQVSFPGGRIDPGDASPEAAALREAREEVGLDPRHVELLGRLSDYTTFSGFRITPVLGLLSPGFATEASPDEVEAVFQLPLAVLLDPAAPEKRRAEHLGHWREYWVWPHPDHFIWGATASILVHLARRLRGELPDPPARRPIAREPPAP